MGSISAKLTKSGIFNLKLEKIGKMIEEINELTQLWCEKVRSDLEMNTMLDSDFVKIRKDESESGDESEDESGDESGE